MTDPSNIFRHAELIADDLAEKSFSIVDNFLTADEVDGLLESDEFNHGKLQFRKAAIGKGSGKQLAGDIRGDFIHWIDPGSASPPVVSCHEKVLGLIPLLNRALFLSLKGAELHLTFYPPGTFYKRHLDQFKSDDHRRLSVICYLNKDWTDQNGGQLRLYFQDRHLDVLPVAGRLVCFRSDLLEHEVLPANRERLSLTGWLVDNSIT